MELLARVAYLEYFCYITLHYNSFPFYVYICKRLCNFTFNPSMLETLSAMSHYEISKSESVSVNQIHLHFALSSLKMKVNVSMII